jgi:hypothetical protein
MLKAARADGDELLPAVLGLEEIAAWLQRAAGSGQVRFCYGSS